MKKIQYFLQHYALIAVFLLSSVISASAAKYAVYFDCDFDFFQLTCTLKKATIQEVSESSTLPHGPEYDSPDIPVLDLSAPIQFRGKEFSITSIYDYSLKLESVKELTLPAHLDRLYPYLFLDCPNLERIRIAEGSNGVYYTGDDGQTLYLMDETNDWLIWAGKELERYELPEGVAINPGALYNTSKLSELVIDSSNPDYSYTNKMLFTKDYKTLIAILPCVEIFYASEANPKFLVKEIANYAVGRHSKINHVIMDRHFISEGYKQMRNCPITSADVITGLVDNAFSGWKMLKEINFDTSFSRIPNSFAYGCESLEKVVLPENFNTIGINAFSDCINLTILEAPNLETLEPYALDGTNIDLNDLPETLKSVYRKSIATRCKIDSYTLPPHIIPSDNWDEPVIIAEVGTLEINHQYPLIGGERFYKQTTVHSLGINCNTLVLGEGMKKFNPCIFGEGYRPDKIVIPGSEMVQIQTIKMLRTPMNPHDGSFEVFDDFPQNWRKNVTLYVADNLVEEYKTNKYWNQLKIYSLSGEYSGAEDVTADGKDLDFEVADGIVTVNGENGQSVEIYSLDGKRVAAGVTGQPLSVGKGLHIIRCGSAAEKVMVK